MAPVNFPHTVRRLRASRPGRESVCAESSASELASRLAVAESRAKEDIRRVIFLLDLTVQHARQIIKCIADPPAKSRLEREVAAVENLLQIARSMALRL